MSFADIPLLYEDAQRPRSLQLSEFTRSITLAFFDRFLRKGHNEGLDWALSHGNIGSVTKFPQ